jgi:formylglycine-generating enzyme required for sulfatase activity
MKRLAIGVWVWACMFLTSYAQEMKLITGGSFKIGGYGYLDDEVPSHYVSMPSYYMDETEVTYEYWFEIANWATRNGYDFSDRPEKAKDGPFWAETPEKHPMNMIKWYDAVKWCNARSEKEGRKPCYYTDSDKTTIYRKGEIDINNQTVDWTASGYRLPTEAEWERAARGNLIGASYPWGVVLESHKANYRNSGDRFDNASTPVKSYQPNDYGLYDMTGNVSEWCWDWYNPTWYSTPESWSNPRGPTQLPNTGKRTDGTRVYRGASFSDENSYERGYNLRIAFRHQRLPAAALRSIGIRCVRSEYDDALWIDKKTAEYPNWKNLNWFGYYYEADNGWVYHAEFGWIYPQGKGSYDNWIYFPAYKDWIWTCREIYPYVFSKNDQDWYYYDIQRKLFL